MQCIGSYLHLAWGLRFEPICAFLFGLRSKFITQYLLCFLPTHNTLTRVLYIYLSIVLSLHKTTTRITTRISSLPHFVHAVLCLVCLFDVPPLFSPTHHPATIVTAITFVIEQEPHGLILLDVDIIVTNCGGEL